MTFELSDNNSTYEELFSAIYLSFIKGKQAPGIDPFKLFFYEKNTCIEHNTLTIYFFKFDMHHSF